MGLAGQGGPPAVTARARHGLDDRGYLLAVLLMGMAVAAIWMAGMLPAWRHQAQREREISLIFRGEQYARAIVLFNRRFGTLPPSIDTLVEQGFLRKKWKDPVTGCDFVPIGTGIVSTPQPGCAYRESGVQGTFDPANLGAQTITPSQGGQVGITGVRSMSTQASIKIYQNQQQYNLWPFDYQLLCQRMGGCGPQGGQGGRGGGPGRAGGDGRGGAGRGGTELTPITPGGGRGGRGGDAGRGGGGRGGGGGGRGGGS